MNKILIFLYVIFVIFLFCAGLMQLKTDATQFGLPIFHYNSYVTPMLSLSPKPIDATQSAEFAVVKRVVDGDTIELTDGRKVRYIGIDTPELHHPIKKVQCFGKEAMEKNKELVEGKKVKMVKDISDTDRYKRLLRYIYTTSANSGQEVFVNEYLAKEGYASQATFPPDIAYSELFGHAVESARAQNKGLWNKCK